MRRLAKFVLGTTVSVTVGYAVWAMMSGFGLDELAGFTVCMGITLVGMLMSVETKKEVKN